MSHKHRRPLPLRTLSWVLNVGVAKSLTVSSRTVTLRSFGVAPGSGPVPGETSVCLIRGTAMGSVTAGMAATRPDVSVGGSH